MRVKKCNKRREQKAGNGKRREEIVGYLGDVVWENNQVFKICFEEKGKKGSAWVKNRNSYNKGKSVTQKS